MKRSWSVLLLLASACAGPSGRDGDVRLIVRSLPIEPSAFDVAESTREPQTKRYRIRHADCFAEDAEPYRDFEDPDGSMPPEPPPGDLESLPALHVARVIRAMVAPDSWGADPRRALIVEGDELVVRHVPEVLDRVDRMIATLKAHRHTLVSFSVRSVPVAIDGEIGIDSLYPVSGGLAGVIDRAQIPLLQSRGPMAPSAYPKITAFAGQACNAACRMSDLYVEGYLPVDQGWAPKVAVLHHGITLRARGVPNGPGSDRLLIHISIERSELKELRNLRLGAGIVQMPVVAESRVAGRFVVAPGQAVLIVLRPGGEPTGRPDIMKPEAVIVEAQAIDYDER